jgi:glycerol-3-phosphate acyltransferase PlsX
MTGPEASEGVHRDGTAAGRTVISVDAMGGDRGPAAVVAGLHYAAQETPGMAFILHGDEAVLRPLVARRRSLAGRCDIRHAPRVVQMTDKPSHVMRHGEGTSMWSAIDAVKSREATVAVSCGNTGALMALSMIRLRKLPGVNRPAIACLWPSRNRGGFNLMLDVGADIRADAEDLVQFAAMGAAYAREGLNTARPRVGLLNVGTEEHKGRAELKLAHDRMAAAAAAGAYEFVGFVEGGDIPSDRVDVIVTDGFTGNVALKTGEGTAKLISDFLREAFNATFLSRIAAVLALTSLRRLRIRIDPRRVNGGVFLGLNGTVVKSHGAADATGIAAAVRLAHDLARSQFTERLAERVAETARAGQSAGDPAGATPPAGGAAGRTAAAGAGGGQG